MLQLLQEGDEVFLFFRLSVAWDGLGEGLDEHDLSSCCCNVHQTFQGGKGHEADIGHDDGGVASGHVVGEEVAVGHVIDIVAALDDGLDSFNELGCTSLHRVDVEEGDGTWLVVEHIIVG